MESNLVNFLRLHMSDRKKCGLYPGGGVNQKHLLSRSLASLFVLSLSVDFTLAVVGRRIGIAHRTRPPAGLNLPLLNLERVSVGLPLEKLLEERWRTSERRGYCSAPKLTLNSSSSLAPVS